MGGSAVTTHDYRYSEEKHEYYIDGGRVPNVTEILGTLCFFHFKDNPDALSFGKAMHKTINLWERGLLDGDILDPSLEGGLESYQKWKDATGFKYAGGEIPMYHANQPRFGGTPDLFGRDARGSLCLPDLKTGNAQKWTAAQTAGYALLLRAHFDLPATIPILRFALEIQKTGKIAIAKPYPVTQNILDEAAFLSCASTWWWRERYK